MSKSKENEFEGMPERTLLGKKAIEFCKQKVAIEKAKDKLDDIGYELIELFSKADKKKIVVEGSVVSMREVLQKQINVKKPKNS